MQQIGSSGSCFSIRNFLDIDDRFLTSSPDLQAPAAVDIFLSKLHLLSPQGVGLLSSTDV